MSSEISAHSGKFSRFRGFLFVVFEAKKGKFIYPILLVLAVDMMMASFAFGRVSNKYIFARLKTIHVVFHKPFINVLKKLTGPAEIKFFTMFIFTFGKIVNRNLYIPIFWAVKI